MEELGAQRHRPPDLDRRRRQRSMGQVGTAADNAAMESSFSLLQKNVRNTRQRANCDELRIATVTWIERTYHRRRRQPALGQLTPKNTKPS